MEVADDQRSEVNVPQPIAGFLEGDVLLGEHVTDVHPVVVPANAAVLADPTNFPMGCVLEGREGFRVRTRFGSGWLATLKCSGIRQEPYHPET